jgi:ankyrin repeat protein
VNLDRSLTELIVARLESTKQSVPRANARKERGWHRPEKEQVIENPSAALRAEAGTSPNPDAILVLLKRGADINAANTSGQTALMFAVQNPLTTAHIVSKLLKAGADINAADNRGQTALMFIAQECRDPEIVSLLLTAGAGTEVKDMHG